MRDARVEDAAALTDLALRSKASWGYDAAFMRDCRHELAVSPDMIGAGDVRVCESGTRKTGFYRFVLEGRVAAVELFFVEPAAIGTGVGRTLWRDLCHFARARGATRIEIESDPHAAGFYERMGAVPAGTRASGSIAGRRLPFLVYAIDGHDQG